MKAILLFSLIAVASAWKLSYFWNYYADCADYDGTCDFQVVGETWPDDWYDCADEECYDGSYGTFWDCDSTEFDFTTYTEYDIYDWDDSYCEGDAIGTLAFYSETEDCDPTSDCCYNGDYYITDATCDCDGATYTECNDIDCSDCYDSYTYSWYWMCNYWYADGNYFYVDISPCDPPESFPSYLLTKYYMGAGCGDCAVIDATEVECTIDEESECFDYGGDSYKTVCIDGADYEDEMSGGLIMATYCKYGCFGAPYNAMLVMGGCWAEGGYSSYVECDEDLLTWEMGDCSGESCDEASCVVYTGNLDECSTLYDYQCGASSVVVSLAAVVLAALLVVA